MAEPTEQVYSVSPFPHGVLQHNPRKSMGQDPLFCIGGQGFTGR